MSTRIARQRTLRHGTGPVAAAMLWIGGVATATVYTWDKGAGTLDWNTPANWTPESVPGSADTAKFTSTGLAAGNVVTLGANQTINELDLSTGNLSGGFAIGNGPTHSLTLTSGRIFTTYGTASKYILDAPLVLGANGVFEWTGGYGANLEIRQPISDGGLGYGVTFGTAPGQQVSHNLLADCTYSGPTLVQCMPVRLTGATAAIRNSAVTVRTLNNQGVGVDLRNQDTVANGDRLGDDKSFTSDGSGGSLWMRGHASTPVAEQIGTLTLNSGRFFIQSTYYGASVESRFAGVSRLAGSSFALEYTGSGSSAGANNKIAVAGAANVNGMWYPWAVAHSWAISHLKVAASNVLVPVPTGDYTQLPASGADGTKLYKIGNATELALTASQSVYALIFDNNNTNQTLKLGNYDLRVNSGSIGVRERCGKLIESTGGKLIFAGPEVSLFASCNVGATISKDFTISCPMAMDAAGPGRLVVPTTYGETAIRLVGPDLIGEYASISSGGSSPNHIIELGGTSDRTVTGPLTGAFALRKSGEGSLRLAGADQRGTGDLTVQGGRLVLANNAAYAPGFGGSFIVTNATVEVAEGINHGKAPTLRDGAVVAGLGRFDATVVVTNGVHVAPGSSVGKLTFKGAVFSNGSHLHWQLGDGTTTAGVDYDLLGVDGAGTQLTFAPGNIAVHVYASGTAWPAVKNKTFTLLQWTGNNPSTGSTTWTVVNESPTKLDTTGAIVSVDPATKRVLLSGLKPLPTGTVVLVR